MTIARGAVLSAYSERLLDDVALAAEHGIERIRLDVPWALAQPRAGAFDGDVFERLRGAAQSAAAAGVQTWFRLLQPAIPHWFDDEGGFTDDRTAGTWWPRWVEGVTDRLGDVAAGWVPFEAPYGMCDRLSPHDARRHGEITHTVLVAWRDAWRILHGSTPVACSLDVAIERPTDESPEAREAANRRHHLRWSLWLQGFTDGVVRIPGRADRPLADLAGSVDVIGLAVRRDAETCLYRAAEHGLGLPLALTFAVTGASDAERSHHVTAMWREVRRAGEQLRVDTVWAMPFVDVPGTPGLATADRELKDSGHAFVAAHP
ncbi:MAG: family 1 glycosylhydrolase [Actinomycetota bacterium]